MLGPEDETPTGCAVFTVSSNATVFLEVAGRIDLDAEIGKAQTKMHKASEVAQKQRKVLDAEGFEDKVSYQVLETEKTKLNDVEATMRNLESSIAQFEQLKLKA